MRLLSRASPDELPVDFQTLHLRKVHQLEKLNQMMAYGTLDRCRRAFLLEYFGEVYPSDNCGGCDSCRSRKIRPDLAKEEADPLLAAKILSGVARLKGRFGQGMAVKMLTGSREKAVEKFGLNRLSTYGLLAEFTQEQVEKWIQELIGQGLSETGTRHAGREKLQGSPPHSCGMGGHEKKGEGPSLFILSQGRDRANRRRRVSLTRVSSIA